MIESVRLLLGQQTFHWWLLPFTHGWKEEHHRCISLAAACGRSLFTFVQRRQWSLFCNVYGNIPQYLLKSSMVFKTHVQTIHLVKCMAMAANNYVWPGPTTICWTRPKHLVFSLWYSIFWIIYLHFNLGHSCTVVTCLCSALLDSSCTKCLCCTESILMRVGYYIKESDQLARLLI